MFNSLIQLQEMDKTILNVPRGIEYLSDWEGFSLPVTPTIINKQITGCGFTEWCIRSTDNIVLCSPRCVLLDNKAEQHPEDVFYAKNELDESLEVDKDLISDKPTKEKVEKILSASELEEIKESVQRFRDSIFIHYFNCCQGSKPCKILVTYDSFRHVKEALGDHIKEFNIVVDEFQSIFTDSRFKSDTELEFLNQLKGLDKVSFVSATPMMDDYLEMLPEFKDLPYYQLDWGALDPGRITKPQLDVIPCQRILDAAERFIKPYLDGDFKKSYITESDGKLQEIESKELVIYVNSVKNICDIIRRNGLTYSNTNVLCSNTPENRKKIRKAFGFTKKSDPSGIGKVPKKGESHKMFTLCTRTVYLGADFYSTNARSLILSDANVECLAVDITLDLPQIIGRQRLKENPWKNRATLYFKSITNNNNNLKDINYLKGFIGEKRKATDELLHIYNNCGSDSGKHFLAKKYQKAVKLNNYKDDYISVNKHLGGDLIPVFNNLVMVSEIRAFEIQQVDYKDRFSVFNSITKEFKLVEHSKIVEFIDNFNSMTLFPDKMKLLCNCTDLSENEILSILDLIPIIYKNYYISLGKDKIKTLKYRKSLLEEEYNQLLNTQDNSNKLDESILSSIIVGNRYTRQELKEIIRNIYNNLDIKLVPKSTILDEYFELKKVLITNKETGKRDNGFEILRKKEGD